MLHDDFDTQIQPEELQCDNPIDEDFDLRIHLDPDDEDDDFRDWENLPEEHEDWEDDDDDF
jgi:hypothetical protein